MQIKVKNTKLHGGHNEPFKQIEGKSVAEAKLVLVGHNQCDGCLASKPITDGNHRMGNEGKYANLQGCTKMQYLKSILISLTEKIENKDWIWDMINGKIFQADGAFKAGENGFYKILALPEHFSSKHLQDIVDGKMKDGMTVLLECDEI